MSDDATEIQTLLMRAKSEGFEAVEAQINSYVAAQLKAGDAVRALMNVADDADRKTQSYARAYDRQTMAFDLAAKAAAGFARELKILEAAKERGIVTNDQYASRLAVLESYFKREADAANHAAGANNFNRMQTMELLHVSKSIVDQLAAGASPMRAFEVEGGRIAQVFAEGQGGVTGTLKAMGSALGGVITSINPVTAGIAAVVGVSVAGAAAWYSYTEAVEKAESAVAGAGRASGLSATGLTDLASRVASVALISESAARDMASELARSGKVSADMIAAVTARSRDFAATVGVDFKTASADLSKAFDDPAKGAESLNEKLGFLDDTTRHHIQTLAEQGERYAAQQALLQAMEPSLDSASSHVTALGEAWAYVSSRASQAAFSMGKAIDAVLGYSSAEEKLRNLQIAKSMPANTGPTFGIADDLNFGGLFQKQRDQLGEEESLQEQVRMNSRLRDAQARTVELNQRSLVAGAAARSAIPGLGHYESLINQNEQAKTFLSTPGASSKTDIDIITDAMQRRTNAIKSMTDANGKFMTSEENRAAIERLQGRAALDRKNASAYSADMRQIAELQLYGKEVNDKERADLLAGAASKAFDRSTAHQSTADPFGNAILAAQKATSEIDLKRQDIGLTPDVLAAQKVKLDLLTSAKKDHIAVTDQVMAKIDAEAAKRAAATRALQDAERQYQALNDIENRVADAGVNLFEGAMQGAKGFQSALRGVAQELEKMLLQGGFEGKGPFAALFGTAASTNGQVGGLFGSLFGNQIAGGGGFGSLLGSLFGGFHATGGDILGGKIGVVGENGPELVQGPASITPLSKLPTSGAGGTVNMTLNHTIDLAGANGDDAINRSVAAGAQQAVQAAVQAVRQQFPGWQVDLQQRGA